MHNKFSTAGFDIHKEVITFKSESEERDKRHKIAYKVGPDRYGILVADVDIDIRE